MILQGHLPEAPLARVTATGAWEMSSIVALHLYCVLKKIKALPSVLIYPQNIPVNQAVQLVLALSLRRQNSGTEGEWTPFTVPLFPATR